MTGYPRKALGVVLIAVSSLLSGCSGGDADLIVATNWAEPDRERIAEEFHRWRQAPGRSPGRLRMSWRVLSISDDPARAASRVPPVDVLLGGPASAYARLARAGRLESAEGDVAWRVVRNAPVGLAINTRMERKGVTQGSAPDGPGTPPARGDTAVIFDDPRNDPVTLAWAKGRLGQAETWAQGYARLVRCAGHPRRIGDRRGAALAAIERGEAALAPAVAPLTALRNGILFVADTGGGTLPEGAAIVLGSSHRERAREFLRFLAERVAADASPSQAERDLAGDSLLADLLGATLVDAQDELWAAWAAVERTGRDEHLEMLIGQSPPWPPASVAKLIQTDSVGALLETLAEQIAPDAGLRAWLMRSWLGASRSVDGPLIQELAGAVDGRLCREPRFRAWLRAEWTAWAQQRYRRVARMAGGRVVSR